MSASIVPYAIIFSIPDIIPFSAQVEKFYCIVFSTIPIQYFLFEPIDQDLSNSPQPLSKKAGRLEPAKRKNKKQKYRNYCNDKYK